MARRCSAKLTATAVRPDSSKSAEVGEQWKWVSRCRFGGTTWLQPAQLVVRLLAASQTFVRAPVHMDVMRWRRLVPGADESCRRMPFLAVLPLPLPPLPPVMSAACSRTRASSRGAVAKPATARAAPPATSGAYGPADAGTRIHLGETPSQQMQNLAIQYASIKNYKVHCNSICAQETRRQASKQRTCRGALFQKVIVQWQVDCHERDCEQHRSVCAPPERLQALVPRNLVQPVNGRPAPGARVSAPTLADWLQHHTLDMAVSIMLHMFILRPVAGQRCLRRRSVDRGVLNEDGCIAIAVEEARRQAWSWAVAPASAISESDGKAASHHPNVDEFSSSHCKDR